MRSWRGVTGKPGCPPPAARRAGLTPGARIRPLAAVIDVGRIEHAPDAPVTAGASVTLAFDAWGGTHADRQGIHGANSMQDDTANSAHAPQTTGPREADLVGIWWELLEMDVKLGREACRESAGQDV